MYEGVQGVSIELKLPIYSQVEDYLKKVFQFFNEKIDPNYKINILVGAKSGGFLQLAGDTSVFNLYSTNVSPKHKYNTGVCQDTVGFNIDIFVSPSKNNELTKEKYQDTAAHKFLLLYTNYARNLLTDLSIRRFGISPKYLGNFRFAGIESFEPEYSDSEIAYLGARINFSLDIMFYPTDSNEYNELSAIIVNMGNNLDMLFNKEKIDVIQ